MACLAKRAPSGDRSFLGAWSAILDAGERKAKAFFVKIFAVRPVKLDFFDHPFTCPLCKEHIVYTSMNIVLVDSRRKCPSCEGELLINEGVITATGGRKPPNLA